MERTAVAAGQSDEGVVVVIPLGDLPVVVVE